MFGFPSAKRAKQKGGGPIVGQGTGTSDSIDKQTPVGSYIMPADSTAAVGHDGLAKLGFSKKSVPISVSNGEHEMLPEQVHAVGVQALNQLKAATHQPVAADDQGPRQFFANGGLVEDPEEVKQRARIGIPSVRPGYDAMPAVRSAQAAVDSAMQSGSVRNAETAQRGLLGEAVTTAAGQQAIQTALTPPMPTLGNPERAARMQAQFDQPVTKGGQPKANQPVAAGIPSPKAGGPVSEGLRGVAEAGLGIAAYPASAVWDGVRNAAGYLSGGDTDQLTQYREGAAEIFGTGVDRMSDSAAQLRESAGATVRGALGIEKRTQTASTGQPSASNPYSGEPFDQWAKSQGAMPSTSPATPNTSPISADAPGEQGNGYTRTGIGQGRQGGEIVGRIGANGVPEFTNEAATPGAVTGAASVGGIGRVGNGQGGTFSVGAPGDAQLAYDRNERAIAEREKMIGISRRGEIGEGGGRVTVVRDSSRVPGRDDRLRARNDEQIARTEALRTDAQLGLKRDARESADSQLNRGVQQQQLQVGSLDIADRQRIQNLYAQYESAAPGERAALAEQIRTLTGKDQAQRFTVVPGGQEVDPVTQQLVTRPARVINNQTGSFVDQQGGEQASQPEQGAAKFESGRVYRNSAGERAIYRGVDANGNDKWESV
ncbi:hypothetical protein SAMN05216206_2745 [Pseudomonas guineae]|uniref:Uncharacterized protein n=1 Tax=Pseudomonas guineae TaxID=425504 RepID=A0A1I3K8U2_9PSED|nr:hypothetical protein [Pseudomonas guineae]SFI68625.1 hypothetical protein SAMN05216206_2745 [Pseudomonas guineae]